MNHTLPLSIGRTCDLFLANRIWQRWWDVTPVFILLSMSLQLTSLARDFPASFEERSCQVVRGSMRWPHGKELREVLGLETGARWQPEKHGTSVYHSKELDPIITTRAWREPRAPERSTALPSSLTAALDSPSEAVPKFLTKETVK